MSRALLALLLFAPSAGAADLLVDFAPGGPKVVRVEVTLDGQPTGPLWEAAVGDLFKFFDANADGKLDKAECERLVASKARRRGNLADDSPNDFGFLAKLAFDAKAEAVDRAGFAAALQAAGFGPVTITARTGRPENAALTAALFKHLDTDGDGTLSPAELKNARAALETFDVNEDEWLTPAELLGRAAGNPQRAQAPGRRTDDAAAAPDWLVLQGDEASAVAALVKRGVPKLDAAGAAALLRGPADLTIAIALSSEPGKSRATHAGPAAADGRRVAFEGGGDFGLPAERRDAVVKAFAKAKSENSSPFGVPAGEGAFADAYVKFAACRATLDVTDRGRSLFDWLDTDGDGRLSPRELNAAAARFPGGLKLPGDVPRQVDYVAGPPDRVPSGFATAPGLRLAIGESPPEPPAWFTKMDRNGDGDVSLREFLGPLGLFRKLDADGDGLISAAEALKR